MQLDYLALQSALNDAVAGRSTWENGLQSISGLLGAKGAVLISTSGRHLLVSSPEVAEVSERYAREAWQARDIRFRGLQQVRRTGIAVDLDFTDEAEIRGSDYYNDFLAPHGLLWSAIVDLPTSGGHCVVSFQRSRDQGPFSIEEQRALLNVRTLFCGSVEVAQQLEAARFAGLFDGMELLQVGAVAIAPTGHVVRMNAIAEAMMPRHFSVAGGRLSLRDRQAAGQLERRLAAMVKRDGVPTSGPVILHAAPHAGVLPSLCYVIAPPEDWRGHPASRVCAIALFVDPAASHAPVEQLSVLFKLTAGQARIAARLAEGMTLEAAADACGISKETARTHLKAVFVKTGTTRQSELVALLAHLLPIPGKP